MALIVAGCGTPKPMALKSDPSEAGQAPANYRKFIQKNLQDTLVDAPSIRDLVIGTPKLSKCEETYYADRVYKTTIHGWVVPVQFNAKKQLWRLFGKDESLLLVSR